MKNRENERAKKYFILEWRFLGDDLGKNFDHTIFRMEKKRKENRLKEYAFVTHVSVVHNDN